MTDDAFTAPDAARARAHRTYAALERITARHAGTEARRRRHTNPYLADPYEAVALVTALAAGGAEREPGEEPVDEADLTAALTLLPHLRAELDTLEAGLLTLARGARHDLAGDRLRAGAGQRTGRQAALRAGVRPHRRHRLTAIALLPADRNAERPASRPPDRGRGAGLP
ncbi:hypothetical protein, partial [Micromonospora sp. 4G55]|uniref:hypothetical protein n=1 Tax=Micromonospora sp. 4G55 TaxID=2806102 RepID=UPI001EE40D22